MSLPRGSTTTAGILEHAPLSTKGKKVFYHPELDALRFFAFLQVFYYHIGNQFFKEDSVSAYHGWKSAVVACFKTGILGVDLFFCLSSFLITSLLLRECDLNGTFDLKRFWIRRILRIWPLYFFFLALAVFVLPHIADFAQPWRPGYVATFALFGGNWACALHGLPPFPGAILWSVSVEEQFYLLWPLLLLLFTPRRLTFLAVGGLILASLTRVVFVAAGAVPSPHPLLWTCTLTQIDSIALGALFAMVVRQWKWNPAKSARTFLAAIGLVVPIMIILLLGSDVCFNTKWSIAFFPVAAICCTCLLGAIYREDPVRMPSFLVYLGRISYGLYVYHMLAIDVANHIPAIHVQGLKHLNVPVFLLASCALTVGMAAVSYRYLEQPFLRLKSKFTVIRSTP